MVPSRRRGRVNISILLYIHMCPPAVIRAARENGAARLPASEPCVFEEPTLWIKTKKQILRRS